MFFFIVFLVDKTGVRDLIYLAYNVIPSSILSTFSDTFL